MPEEITEVELDSLKAGDQPDRTGLKLLAQEALLKSYEIFEMHGEQIRAIRPSVRRMGRLFGEPAIRAGLNHIDDLCFDLEGEGLSANPKQAKDTLRHLDELSYLYFPLAQRTAEVRYSQCWDYFDLPEVMDIATGMIERIIWESGNWHTLPPEQAAEELQRRVRSNLFHLPHAVEKECKLGRFSMVSNDSLFEDSPDDLLTRDLRLAYYDDPEVDPLPPIGQRSDYFTPRQTPMENATDILAMTTRQIGLRGLSLLATRLNKREQLVLLTHLGYAGSEKTTLETMKSMGINRNLYQAIFFNTIRHLDELNSPETVKWLGDNIKETVYPQTIMSKLDTFRPLKMNKRVLHHDSARHNILDAIQEAPERLASLKDIQRTIMELATMTREGKFVHNNHQIAQQLGLREEYVERVLTDLGAMSRGELTQYVNENDLVLRTSSPQATMIAMVPTLEPWMLCGLSEQQQNALRLITTRLSNGKYISWERAMTEIGATDGKFISNLLYKKLGNPKYLAEIRRFRDGITRAVQNLGSYKENHQQIINYVYEQLQSGKPLRGATGGISAVNIAKALGMKDPVVSSVLLKIEKEFAKTAPVEV